MAKGRRRAKIAPRNNFMMEIREECGQESAMDGSAKDRVSKLSYPQKDDDAFICSPSPMEFAYYQNPSLIT